MAILIFEVYCLRHSNQKLPSTRLRLLRERSYASFLFHCNECSTMRRSLNAKQSKRAFNYELKKIQSRGYFRSGGGYFGSTPLHLGTRRSQFRTAMPELFTPPVHLLTPTQEFRTATSQLFAPAPQLKAPVLQFRTKAFGFRIEAAHLLTSIMRFGSTRVNVFP